MRRASKRKKTFNASHQFESNLGNGQNHFQPGRTFPAPHRLARRSFIRSLATSAAAIMLVCSAPGHLAQAADGDLDPTFGTGGMVITDLKS